MRGKGFGENPMFCEANRGESVSPMGLSPTNKEGGDIEGGEENKEKEEVIDSTHTNQLSESEAYQICLNMLTPEEQAILTAKPLDSEPDKAKIKWKNP